MIKWINKSAYGVPDEPGTYICRFADGSVETYPYEYDDEDDILSHWHDEHRCPITHWTELPEFD